MVVVGRRLTAGKRGAPCEALTVSCPITDLGGLLALGYSKLLGYCNALYLGLALKLQLIQNVAASAELALSATSPSSPAKRPFTSL